MATDGVLQAGTAYLGGQPHAVVWGGTADSVVDLGFGQVLDARNGIQVGWNPSGAAVWHGTPESVEILPGGQNTYATCVSNDGVILGYQVQGFYVVPVMWTPQASDTTPPQINDVSVSAPSVWPPNKKMVPITLYYNVTDDMTAADEITCEVSVSCNEAVPSSAMSVIDPHRIKLLADRNGNGTGRVYTILIKCTDKAGNSSTTTVTVTVPHNQ